MKITIYELLGMVKDGKAPKKVFYKTGAEYTNGYHWNYDESFRDYKDKAGDYVFNAGNYHIIDMLNMEVEILEEEKKIPEKLPYYSMEKIQKAKNKDEWREERITLLEKRVSDLHIKMNDLLDYLKSKGDE